MSAQAFIKVDKATFLKFVAANDDARYEYEQGRIVQQMTGGTQRHGRIAGRFYSLIGQQVDPRTWVTMFERGVETPVTIRFADVLIEPATELGDSLVTTNPALIVEVLSPSSTARDLDAKPSEYLGLASVQAYIVASQDEPACLVWLRGADGAFPAEPVEIKGQAGMIRVAQLSVEIALADVYRGIC
jgi:Uma2 family endonuclease